MKGAVQAHVEMNRISFEVDGHAWVLVNGAPISRADQLWVLHQPEFKPAEESDGATFGNQKLVQTRPGLWEPAPTAN